MIRQKSILYLLLFMVLLWVCGVILASNTPHDPLQMKLADRLKAPGPDHLCGTDELGRDILSRILGGFTLTISVSLMAFFTSFVIGTLIGAIAGYYYGSYIDRVFNWCAAMLFSLPFLLIITAVMSVIEKNIFNAYLVMTSIIWVSPARIVRAGIIKAATSNFVLAERAMGQSEWYILYRSLIPLSIKPAFIFSFRYFPEIIGMEAGLSFLGLGVQPPNPGLGKMIFDSINYFYSAWWYAFFPAFLLFLIVCLSNILYRFLEKENEALDAITI